MATRIKTIEYAFALATADVASATARDFTSFTMYIPESSPVFKSVILEMTAYDTATAASVTAVLMGISLGAVARNDLTVTQTITNSGENQAFIFTRDVTDYFSTNWTGTSMTVGSRLTITGVGTRSCTSKLIITYQYDDSATTQIKTVRIPMEGNTGNLTAVLANLGGVASQIPALSTWLPETSKVIRDIFFETYAHTGATGTTDRALNMSFNSGTNTISATYEQGLSSDYSIKRIDKLISGTTPLYDTGSTWSVQASTANVDMPFPCLSGIYTVTYEFNASTTTEVMNSLLLPIVDENGYVTTSTNTETYTKDVFIQEPGPISLEQSSILFSCIDSGAVTIDLTIGAQTSRQYAHAATAARAGAMYMMRRFDAASVEDSGIVLARGRNSISLNYYSTSATAGSKGSNASSVMILNYKSGKSPQGIGAHNKTSIWCIRPYTSVTIDQQVIFDAARPPEIPETDPITAGKVYWITCNGYCSQLLTTGGTVGTLATSLQIYKNPTGTELGWVDLYSSMYNSDTEIGPSIMWNTCKGSFAQWEGDWRKGRSILETATPLTLRYDQLTAIGHIQVQKYLTYHSITSSISGVVSNFLNPSLVEAQLEITDGVTGAVGVDLYGLVSSATINSNGNYSGFYWYDDTINVKVNVIEYDSNNNIFRVGESKAQPISGSTFNVELAKNPTTYYSFG